MTWFRIDDDFGDHPKVMAIPKAHRLRVTGLWTLCGIWAARQGTRGYIPANLPAEKGAKAGDPGLLVAARVRPTGAGLWVEVDGGWLFHDWDIYQRTPEQIEAVRAARAEAGRAGGRASGEARRNQTRSKPGSKSEAIASAVVDPGFVASEPRPGPARPGPTAQGPGPGGPPDPPPRPQPDPQPAPAPPAAAGPAHPGHRPDDVAGDVHLTGEVISAFGRLLPEAVYDQLDHAAIDGACTRLALDGWTRVQIHTALDAKRATLARSRGTGLAMSVLRDLERAKPPVPEFPPARPDCPHQCARGLLEDGQGHPGPCPHCRPDAWHKLEQQRARTWTLGPGSRTA